MNALVIGASSETIYSIKKAHQKGLKVFTFDGNPLAEGLQYGDQSFIVDIRDPQKIFDIIDSNNLNNSDMIILPVPIGRYLISTGAVNDHYNLIGPSGKTADICTDKWLFHQTLYEKGLRNINCNLIKAGELCTLEKINFPSIAKPRFGAGSRQVLMLSNPGDYEGFVSSMPFDEDFIIEDLVDGVEYGVDAMVIDGTFHLILARKKLITPPPYRQCVGYISVNNNSANIDLLNRLNNFMSDLVKAVDLKNGLLHADIIDDGNDLFIIEMSPRPSGHRLHNLFTPIVTGVDMITEYINYASSKQYNIEPQNTEDVYLIRYFDMESEVVRIPDKEALLQRYPLIEYECNLQLGRQSIVKDGHSLMERGFFIMKGSDENYVCDAANNLLKEFTYNG